MKTKLEFSSLEKYLQAEAIYRDIADDEGLATCLHGVSRMHILLKQPHEALACLDEAQDLFHECSNDDGFEACLLNRAIVMLGWDNQMGLELLVEQEGRLRESQNDRYLIQCLLTQVPVLMRVGKTAEALGKEYRKRGAMLQNE